MNTAELAKQVSALRFEDLPAPVVESAKKALLDYVGVCLFVGKNTPWGTTIADFAISQGAGKSTVISHERRASPARAALANGTMALGFEYEDVMITIGGHPYAALISAALAVGEPEGSSGKDLLLAIVLGYEVFYRTGLASGKSCYLPTLDRGLYPTRLYGSFAAAAAAGKLLKLDADTMTMALGLAGEQSGGTMQSHAEGAWSRRLNGGTAAEQGVTAALLAKAGFIGPRQILEGKYSLYKVLGLDFDPTVLTKGFGKQPFAVEDLWFKAYPCCGGFHTAVDIVLNLRKQHNIDPNQVAKIEAYLGGHTPEWKRTDVPSIVAAQYSAPFCMATAILKGRFTPADFTEQTIKDPATGAFAREKVMVEFDKELVARGEKSHTVAARITIRMKDGRAFTGEEDFPKGHIKNPLTREEHKAKFDDLVSNVLTKSKAAKLYKIVQNIDQVEDINEMTRLLRVKASP